MPPLPRPNPTAPPSSPWNDPFDVLQHLAGGMPDGTVDATTAYSPGEGGRFIKPQSAHNDLMRVRLNFPHLPIIPFPGDVRTVKLTANVPVDLNFPSHSILAMFKGSGDYYVSINGAASVPSSATGQNDAAASMSVFRPEDYLFYLANVSQFSVVSPVDGTIVTLMLFTGS